MRKFLIAAVAMSGLVLSSAAFADHHEKDKDGKKDKGWNGVLIDKACSANNKTEKDAIAHPKSCAMKEGCAKSGYGIVKGDKFIAFDDKGNEVAKKYLAVKEHGMKVHVSGELAKDGKSIKVAEIHPQDKNQKSDDEKKGEDTKDEETKEEKKEEAK